jgi:hypothetical protein
VGEADYPNTAAASTTAAFKAKYHWFGPISLSGSGVSPANKTRPDRSNLKYVMGFQYSTTARAGYNAPGSG